ncbi:hypothetical protein SARC_16467, partial [Sphaeroforma arctica JP610]
MRHLNRHIGEQRTTASLIDYSCSELPTDRVPLIVANHLSYIDVLVLMKLYQPSFVAK